LQKVLLHLHYYYARKPPDYQLAIYGNFFVSETIFRADSIVYGSKNNIIGNI